jgi:hypothetical protein
VADAGAGAQPVHELLVPGRVVELARIAGAFTIGRQHRDRVDEAVDRADLDPHHERQRNAVHRRGLEVGRRRVEIPGRVEGAEGAAVEVEVEKARLDRAVATVADEPAGGVVEHWMADAVVVVHQGLAQPGFLGAADEGLLLGGREDRARDRMVDQDHRVEDGAAGAAQLEQVAAGRQACHDAFQQPAAPHHRRLDLLAVEPERQLVQPSPRARDGDPHVRTGNQHRIGGQHDDARALVGGVPGQGSAGCQQTERCREGDPAYPACHGATSQCGCRFPVLFSLGEAGAG